MKITVLAGGLSPERDVSLTSGALIANALRRRGHRTALIDAYLGAEGEDIEAFFTTKEGPVPSVPEVAPDLKKLKLESGNGNALIGKNVAALCLVSDVVFLALHGAMGENGQIQAFLDCLGVKYTGNAYDGCLLAMDKDLTKKLFAEGGVPTAEGITLTKRDDAPRVVTERVGFPCVIKPCSGGSSVGVSLVDGEEDLKAALETAFACEDRVLVERRLIGREMTVGILGGRALPPVEIIPKTGFYDYKNKYQSGMTDEICPPEITAEEGRVLAETALRAASLLRLNSYCRVDMILTDGIPYCLEVNTLPGMTPLSLLPREAAAAGIGYDELCEIIAQEAAQR